jgi:hypothetical protein
VVEYYPQPRNDTTVPRGSRPYSQREEPRSGSRVEYPSRSQRNVGLCRRLLYENKCTDASCSYLHTPQLLREERERLIQQWQAPRPPNTNIKDPSNSISRQRPLPPGRPPDVKTLNAVQLGIRSVSTIDEEDEELPEESHDRQFNQLEGLMQVSQTNPYWRAAHKPAKISSPQCSENVIATNVMTLFDTGASSGNFVSAAFVQKHHLESHLIKVNRKVKVANGTRVDIHAKLMLQVSFDTDGETTSATLEFNVMQGLSLDIIVGLPAICNYFRDVLGEMMGKAFFATAGDNESRHTGY